MYRQIVSELTMNSPWACWVSTPLPPVYPSVEDRPPRGEEARTKPTDQRAAPYSSGATRSRASSKSPRLDARRCCPACIPPPKTNEPSSHRHGQPKRRSTGAVRFSTKKRTTAPTCCGVKYAPRPSLRVSKGCLSARVTSSQL